MIFCIAGKNNIAINGLNLLLEMGIEKSNIKACINRTDTNENNWQPSYKRVCNELGIEIVSINELYEIEDLFFLSLEYDRIIDVKKFKSTKLYNIHFSLLPEFKGMYTSAWPILLGKTYSGVTLHRIDSGIDTGDIINQIKFDIEEYETAYDLYFKYLKYAQLLLSDNISNLINNNYSSRTQSFVNASYFSKSSIDYTTFNLDFNKTAFEIKNRIRAFSFRPYQLPIIEGFQISHAKITKNKSILKPGTILLTDEFSLTMSTIDFDIIFYKDILFNILKAAEENNLFLFKQIECLGYNLEIKNSKGWNALIVSSYNESKDVFDYLLNSGCNVNATNFNGTNCFMYAMTAACKSGETYYMQQLLDKGADVLVRDNFGKNALEYALFYNNSRVLKFLNCFF